MGEGDVAGLEAVMEKVLGDLAGEGVHREIEEPEAREIAEEGRDGAGEVVFAEVELVEGGEGSELRRDAAGEAVAEEGDNLEGGKASEGGGEGASEGGAVNENLLDVAGGTAGNAGEIAAGVPAGGGVPGG